MLCFLGLLTNAVQLHISQNSERLNLWIINLEARGKTPHDLFLRCYPSILWRMSKTTMGLMNIGIQTEDMCSQNPLQSPQSITLKKFHCYELKSPVMMKNHENVLFYKLSTALFFLSKLKCQTQKKKIVRRQWWQFC